MSKDSRSKLLNPIYLRAAWPFFIWLNLLFFGGCTALGTKITGTGNNLTLSWDAQYPLARQLQTDQRIRLQVVYSVKGRLVNEVFNSINKRGISEITFALPNSLKAVPDGEICLYIKPSTTFSTLPIRPVDSSHGDTAGFRYPAWEEALRNNMRRQQSEQILQQLEKEYKSYQIQLSNNEQLLLKSSVKKPEDCLAIGNSKLPDLERPFDVVELDQHDTVARKVCVRRARNIRVQYSHLDISTLISEAATLRNRQEQAKVFMGDWKRWFSDVGAGYQPEIGTSDDNLPIVSHALYLMEKKVLEKTDSAAIGGGILDAYDGCVEDTKKQLKTKLISWKQYIQSKPDRERNYAEYSRQKCQDELASNQYLTKRKSELQQQINELRSTIDLPRIVLPMTRQVLDYQSCAIP